MENKTYINFTIESALKKYLLFKNKQNYSLAGDFLVYVISVLTYIYGEADIINPYITYNRDVFEKNILKYGYSSIALNQFYCNLTRYVELDNINKANQYKDKNPFFVYVQEDLIDMFIKKYQNQNLNALELNNFEKLLYIPNSNNEYRNNINKIMSPNENEVWEYYKMQIYELNNVISFEQIKKDLLDLSIYEAFGLSEDMINHLSQNDINEINNKILDYYKMSPIEPDLNTKIKKIINLNKPGSLNFKIANNMGMINILLFLLTFGSIILFGIFFGLRMVGK
jgi:hypothetical protein